MKEIYLSNGKNIVLVDDEDHNWLKKYKWHLHSNGYAKSTIKSKSKRMHRLIMNEPAGFDIDHIDHNKLNNQKNNLRIVTRSQNMMNRLKGKNCSSIYKGVCWKREINKWSVQIMIDNKYIHIGVFKIEEEAAVAYNKAAIKLFGEYANLNEVK